jgi:exodeoxyribonuclease X
MSKIIFFDTETTGNTDKDYLCQIAYKDNSLEFNKLYKPPVRIPPEASAVHHISNKMVEDKPLFKESEDYANLKELFENPETISVAHNAPFDIGILKNEDISVAKFICTLRVARALDPEETLSSYRLQFLRYALDIEIEATAHDAFGDVLVLEKLFDRLKNKIKTTENLDDAQAIEKMIEISSHPSIFKKLNFGKHKGKTIEEVVSTDRGWLEWLLAEKIKSDQVEEDWIYTLKHYLNK